MLWESVVTQAPKIHLLNPVFALQFLGLTRDCVENSEKGSYWKLKQQTVMASALGIATIHLVPCATNI